jgi:hypothetical protein
MSIESRNPLSNDLHSRCRRFLRLSARAWLPARLIDEPPAQPRRRRVRRPAARSSPTLGSGMSPQPTPANASHACRRDRPAAERRPRRCRHPAPRRTASYRQDPATAWPANPRYVGHYPRWREDWLLPSGGRGFGAGNTLTRRRLLRKCPDGALCAVNGDECLGRRRQVFRGSRRRFDRSGLHVLRPPPPGLRRRRLGDNRRRLASRRPLHNSLR